MVDQNGKNVSSKSDSANGSVDGSASGASSQQGATVTVSITVDGSSAGAGSSSATLVLPAGATVYDALASCGVSFNAKATGYGMYVSSIAGLAEKEHGGMSGWMYSVNGSTANIACSSYVLSGGESIYWWYATSSTRLFGVIRHSRAGAGNLVGARASIQCNGPIGNKQEG